MYCIFTRVESYKITMIKKDNYIVFIIFTLLSFTVNGQVDYYTGDPFEIGIASPDASNVVLETLTKNDTIYHTFKIKNIGNGDLKITKVNSSMGSSIVDYTADSIAPNNTGIIKVAVFYDDKYGPFTRIIEFNCDGKFKFYQLKIEGYIKEE